MCHRSSGRKVACFLELVGQNNVHDKTPELMIGVRQYRTLQSIRSVRAMGLWIRIPSSFIYRVAVINRSSRLVVEVLSGMATETRTEAKSDSVIYSNTAKRC